MNELEQTKTETEKNEVDDEGQYGTYEDQAKEEKMVTVPDHCVFRMDEIIPMKGYIFRFKGYTKDFMPVFECVGMSSKQRKREGAQRKAVRNG